MTNRRTDSTRKEQQLDSEIREFLALLQEIARSAQRTAILERQFALGLSSQ